MRTLCIDIGGTGIKAIVVDLDGQSLTEHARLATPQPAIPEAIFTVIEELLKGQGEFDRISLGFPGVIREGVVRTAPHLDPSWHDVDLKAELERRYGKPAHVANDAYIQGLAVVEGKGFEVVLTLGTGLGCGLYIDGKGASIEIGHHPFGKKGLAYEDLVGEAARKAAGNGKWKKRVQKVIAQIDTTFNYRKLYLGGGNAARLNKKHLPDNVELVDNIAGLLGGIRLWT